MNAQSLSAEETNKVTVEANGYESDWESLPAIRRHLYVYTILILVAEVLHTYLQFE
ncbi:MAG TPA: hypothetical protein VMZ27_05595 [Candidatus Saccharimonadales bacterium]|nr:hypothetical protein [Candidatus Saccharimonadales bacterium]